jgi:hypothetical protein
MTSLHMQTNARRGLLLALAIFFTIAASLAQAQFKDLPTDVQKQLGAIQKYPKASAILFWVKEDFALQADGSESYEWHSFRYIPDEAARDNWGDPHLAYIEGRQTLEILKARTYTKDGRMIDATPANAFNPIVPENGLDKAPDYSDVRQMVVTMLGLENGCISELHYRLTTPKPILPWLEGRVYFREECPTMARELTVTIPAGVTLTYRADRGAADPAIAGTSYQWTMGEQAGYLEEDLHGHRVLLPNVAFTTAKGWDQIREEFTKRIGEAAKDEWALPASLEASIGKATSDDGKLDSIKTWLRERLNALKFEHPDFTFILRPAARVLESGYGNSLELATLAAQIAVKSEINLSLALQFEPEPVVPSLHEFATALLVLKPAGGGTGYADALLPRAEMTSHDLYGTWIMPLEDKQEPVQYTGRTKVPRYTLSLNLNDLSSDTIRATGTLTAAGEWGVYEAVSQNGAPDYLSNLLPMKGTTITDVKIRDLESPRFSSLAVLDFAFTASALDTADGRFIFPLSLLDFAGFVNGAPWGLTKREFAQEIPMPGVITLHIEAGYPDDWMIETRPAGGSQMWDWSEGKIVSTDQAMVSSNGKNHDRRLIFERSLTLAREWIAPSGWSGFRSWMLASGNRPANAAIFVARPQP